MDNQERDLILDLASGTLPEDEARRLEASLSADARVELEQQRLALAAIHDLGPAPLTDIERRRLHNMVAEGIKDTTREMHAAAVSAPARSVAGQRTVRWMRFAYGAAAAAVFVAAVGVGSQLDIGGGAGDASADTTVLTDAALTGGEEFASDGGADSADSTAAAAPTTTTMAFAAEADDALAAPPIAPPVNTAFEARDLGRIQAWVDSQVLNDAGAVQEGANPTQLSCYGVAIEEAAVVAGFITPYRNQETNQVFDAVGFASEGESGQEPDVQLYDPLTCELLSATSP